MAVRSRRRVPLRTLVEAFEAACKRFGEVAGGTDADAAFIALFDVVAWAGATGDWLRNRSKARSRTVPPTVQGLWYVRNRILHEGPDALFQNTVVVGFGMAPFGVGPFGGGIMTGWAWKPSRSLPRGRSPAGKREYDSLVANKPVTDTLAAASGELARKLRA
jgi:hypothetical protein